MGEAVDRERLGVRSPDGVNAAAAEACVVAIGDFAPATGPRNADSVVLVFGWRQVAHRGDRWRVCMSATNKHEHAVVGVRLAAEDDSLCACVVHVQRWFSTVDRVAAGDPALYATMFDVAEQVPAERGLVRPLCPLGKLHAHEKVLLARLRQLIAEQTPHVGVALPIVARHLG